MKITKGTPKAMAFLDFLKQEGCLVDVYSEEFFDRQPTYDEDPSAPFHKNDMEYIDEMEADPDEVTKPKNHLLFIFLDEYKRDLIDKLLALYPQLAKHFDGFHKPDFIFLNLYTKQMLCVGFGRKNSIFAYDPMYEAHIDFFGNTGIGDARQYISKFTEHDYYDLLADFAEALEQLSQAMFQYAHLPYDEYAINIALVNGPKSDGLYYVDGDNEGHTKEEIEEFLEQYTDCQNRGDDALKVINAFFPQCQWGDLNTGDY